MFRLMNRIFPEDEVIYDYKVLQRQTINDALNMVISIPSSVPRFDTKTMCAHVLYDHGVIMLEVDALDRSIIQVPISTQRVNNSF